MSRIVTGFGLTPLWVAMIAAVLGYGAGRVVDDRGTAAAEIARVSQTEGTPLTECVPAATPLPSPTPTAPPPAGMNTPRPLDRTWTITVLDATKATTIDTTSADGVFVRLSLAVVNTGQEAQRFPVDGLMLRDGADRRFAWSLPGTVNANPPTTFQLPPGGPTDLILVFDVPADASDPFILESKTDPTFRIQIELAQRG